ncbi:DUF2845 domain-containing protein [Thermodesulfobacteriota bacterium]
MKKLILLSIAVIFILGTVAPVSAIERITYKCANLTVGHGVTSAEVEYRCGAPNRKEDAGMSERKTTLERWFYGPSGGYIYILTMGAGRVINIERVKP